MTELDELNAEYSKLIIKSMQNDIDGKDDRKTRKKIEYIEKRMIEWRQRHPIT